MGIPRVLMVLKYSYVISFIVIAAYALYPFINGVGCDFRSRVEDENSSFYTTCKLGFVTTIARNKTSRETIKYHGIYGKTGSTALFFAYDIESLVHGNELALSPVNRLNTSSLYVSKIIEEDGYDWVIIGFPYSRLHKSKRIGPLGFW